MGRYIQLTGKTISQCSEECPYLFFGIDCEYCGHPKLNGRKKIIKSNKDFPNVCSLYK